MRIIAFVFLALFTIACSTKKTGEELAKENCSSCHKFPDPSLLDKKTWNDHVLVEMSYRLGMRNKFELLTKIPEEQFQSAVELNIYPDTPEMSVEDWQSIVDYYVTNAPEKPQPRIGDLGLHQKPSRGKTDKQQPPLQRQLRSLHPRDLS